ncbi:MAG: hypothetical protein KF866_09970 [Phycisphaeraceae bacterium]|nr:hypothetical protein [Phycisphaeraceae bacterium]MCW5754826.1 hypothetical protein [Phycisphaeraceae bacterium]
MNLHLPCAILTLSAASVAADIPTQWSFELQCRSSLDPNIPTFNLPFPSSLSSQGVAIDEDGAVAVRYVTAGIATEGVFYGRAGIGSSIFTINNPADPVFSSDLDLHLGRIALSYLTTGTGAIVINTAGTLVESFPAGGPQGVSNFGGVRLTGDGAIGFRGAFGSNQKYVFDEFIGGVRTQTLIAQSGTGQYAFLFTSSINDSRQLAAKVFDASSNSLVYRFEPDGSRTLIADARTSGPYNSILNGVALGSSGDVSCFVRTRAANEWRLIRSDGIETVTIARPGDLGIVSTDFGNFGPDINASGWVAFRARTTTGHAVFVGDGQSLVRIAGDGDLLATDLGDLVMGFDFGPPTGRQALSSRVAINDAGQIAFAAFMQNGTIGIFVATPDIACRADLSGSSDPNDPSYGVPDGSLDAADFFYFLDQFTAGNLAIADLSGSSDPNDPNYGVPDGSLDAADFFYFLDIFLAGCP